MKTIEQYVAFPQLRRICVLWTGALLLLATINLSVPVLTYAQTLVPPSINLRQTVKPIVPPTRGAVEKLEDRIIAADYRLRALDPSVLRTPPRGIPGLAISSSVGKGQVSRQPYRGISGIPVAPRGTGTVTRQAGRGIPGLPRVNDDGSKTNEHSQDIYNGSSTCLPKLPPAMRYFNPNSGQ